MNLWVAGSHWVCGFKDRLPKTDDTGGRDVLGNPTGRCLLHAGGPGPMPCKEHPARLSELPPVLEALSLGTLGT